MTDVTVTREDGPNGGRYVISHEGAVAEMTYSRAGTARIIIDHVIKGIEKGKLADWWEHLG